MKKITLLATVAIFFFATAVNAQIQKGNVMIGGNITNLNFGLDKPNPFTINLNPKAAWFISDGIALGGDVNFGLATSKGEGTDVTYGVGALGRYYGTRGLDDVIKHSRFFSEVTVGIAGRNISGSDNTNGLGFSFGPGFSYFITPNIGLETLLKYNGNVGFGNSVYAHNIGLGVGFQIYLPGKSTAKKVMNDVR
ncbi:MAG: outer membrane beta-barrel protein [Sphingobacteriaceae bacterium]